MPAQAGAEANAHYKTFCRGDKDKIAPAAYSGVKVLLMAHVSHLLPLHGSAVAYRRGRRVCAVLLAGAPGSGKSTLALRAMRQSGARLVGDDQLLLERVGDRLMLRPAPRLAGLLHVAGVGIVRYPFVRAAPLALVVRMGAERTLPLLPPRRTARLLGCARPLITLHPFEAAAPERLELALQQCALPAAAQRRTRPPSAQGSGT